MHESKESGIAILLRLRPSSNTAAILSKPSITSFHCSSGVMSGIVATQALVEVLAKEAQAFLKLLKEAEKLPAHMSHWLLELEYHAMWISSCSVQDGGPFRSCPSKIHAKIFRAIGP